MRLCKQISCSLAALAIFASSGSCDDGKEAAKRFKKLPEYVKAKRATHIVETLVEWKEFVTRSERDEVMSLVSTIHEETLNEYKPKFKGARPYPEVEHRGWVIDPERVADQWYQTWVVENCVLKDPVNKSSNNRIMRSVVVCSGKIQGRGAHFIECIVLCSSSVEVPSFGNSLVIAAGDGPLTSNNTSMGSTLLFGGSLRNRSLSRSLAMFRGESLSEKGDITASTDSNWVPKNEKLFGLSFYDSTEDGLTVAVDAGRVSVKAIADKKPFATAGVAVGDVIVEVNGKPVDSRVELNRLLCRSTVASGVAKLTVQRGDKSVGVEVKLAEW